jgi:hypothetical protein
LRTARGFDTTGTHSGDIMIDARDDSSMIGVHFKPGGLSAFSQWLDIFPSATVIVPVVKNPAVVK